MARECYGAEAEPAEWWAWYLFGLDSTTNRIVMARRGAETIGMQPLMISAYQHGKAQLKGAVLCAGMVHPSFRRQGVFRRLIAAALEEAWRLGADFAVLGPVRATPSHPERAPLGWEGFLDAARGAAMPVFTLGGITLADMETAWSCGAHGVAMMRGAWSED